METNKQTHIISNSIFATGVFLQPCEVEINGKKQWRWVVTCFEDDSFQDGKSVDLKVYASSLNDLYTHQK